MRGILALRRDGVSLLRRRIGRVVLTVSQFWITVLGMHTNPNAVVTTTSRVRALEYLEAADAYRDGLKDLLQQPARPGPLTDHRRKVAEANANIGHALKAAEVCATLAVAEELRAGRAAQDGVYL